MGKNISNSKNDLSIKILITYHKKDALLKNKIFTPINAGRKIAKDNQSSDLKWLIDNCIGDDTGDNISEKNIIYNEMTSIYWAWKNYAELGNPDYIGHFHYRRHLCFMDSDKSVLEMDNIGKNYIYRQLDFSEKKMQRLCQEYDLIAPMPQWRKSAYEHFERNFNIEELETAINVLKEQYPLYYQSAKEYLGDNKLYFCNIFIMKKEMFFEYCRYIFDILSEVEKRIDMSDRRMYISEWLTGIFIKKIINDQLKVKFFPTAVAETKTIIPVALAADKNYALQMCVTITSLLSTAKKTTFYDIRCLITTDFEDEDRTKIKSLHNQFSNFKVTFYEIDDLLFNNIKIYTSHITKVAFYRLYLAELLQDVSKIIYLDTDLIVCEDLAILYRYALDNNYIAGVKAPGYYYPNSWRIQKIRELEIPFMNQYINSGVLLLNLQKIRNDNLTEAFFKLIKNNYTSEDQDVLNVACYGNIKCLPYRFNVQTKYMGEDSDENYKLSMVIPNDEIEDAQINPVIIHYANPTKPWQDYNLWKADKWLDVAHLSPYRLALDDLRAEKQWKGVVLSEAIDEFIINIPAPNDLFQIPNNYLNDNGANYKVSIIIPCYNAEKYINETLKTCILQTATLPEIEIICIDDGSKDNTLYILSQWAYKFSNIKVFTQGNKGAGAARNLGLKAAHGEFVAFMDADDLYPSNTTLENLYYSCVKNRADICGGSFSTLNGGKLSFNYKFPLDGYVFKNRGFIRYENYQFDFGYTRFIYKLEFIKKYNISFPEYKRYQDPPFFAKAMIAAGEFYSVPELSYTYRTSHKMIKWDEEKICDFMYGIKYMLDISKRNELPKLHFYSYLRLNNQIDEIRSHILRLNLRVLTVFNQLVESIDFDWMKSADNYDESLLYAFNKEELLRIGTTQNRLFLSMGSGVDSSENIYSPMNHVSIRNESEIQSLQSQIANLNYIISETRKSFSYRLGLTLTWLPRKMRAFFIRIFKNS